MKNIKTLRELLTYSLTNYANENAFLIRNKEGYDSINYSKFVNDTFSLASYFVEKGYNGHQIALIGENSYQWVVTYLAAACAGAVIVPIDKELQSEEIAELAKNSESVAIIYSDAYRNVITEVVNYFNSIDCYVIGKKSDKLPHASLDDLISEYSHAKEENYKDMFAVELDSNKMCSIVFTSGTTGVSKGVMLSHSNLISNIKACYEFIRFEGNRFSVLPMHHTYEFTLGVLFSIFQGCAISINNSIKYVSQNLLLFAPTDLVIVPLIAETLYNSIWNTIRKSGKEKTVKNMIKISNTLLKIGIDIRRILFKKVHKALGGNVRNIFCGGAHIDADIARGYIDFGFNFFIGYGITECSPLITANMSLIHAKMSSCGKRISCCDVEIDNQDANGEGEIITKGENIMLGYFKNKEATDAVLHNGWFKTGDIGKFDNDGFLYLTGRIKNIIILNNGKNIYPEEIEGYIYKIPYVKEAMVYASENSSGTDMTLNVDIFPNIERGEADNITNIEDVIKAEIEKINNSISYYKRITNIKFRDAEFDKTTSKKIKRNYNGKK